MKKLKDNLIKNYKKFNLDEVIFDEAIRKSVTDGNNCYMEIILGANKYIESYLIKRCKDDIDLEILLLEKYKNAMFTIINVYNLDQRLANQIYESSFESIIEDYDESKSLYNNLIKVMLKKLKETLHDIKIEDATAETILETNDSIGDNEEECKNENEEIENNEYDVKKYINNKYIFELLKEELDNDFEYLVAQFLFGYYGKYYDIENISKFLEVSKDEIFRIYMKVLTIYKEMFSEWYDKEMGLSLENN